VGLLVTGADGFTGRYLVAAAQHAGMRVHALQADLTDAAALAEEVASVQPRRVIHLAGISFVGHPDTRAFYEVNLFGTLNLLQALANQAAPPDKVILASSANIYGNTAVSPIGESQVPAPVNHCAMSKLAMEMMAANFSGAVPVVFARPFNYTGRGQSADFLVPKMVAHFARRLPFIELGNLDVEREFNDVRFVCDAYLKLLESGEAGQAYNICTGRGVSLSHVVGLLRDLTGHHPEVRVNPAFVREHEVHRLCGDPSRLARAIGPLDAPQLTDTLRWMLGDGQ
jgi:nucleoside-diphosphate-sugar epimerase